MALVDIGGLLHWPPLPTHISAAPDFGSILLDANGEKAAFVIQAPKTGSVRKVHFRTSTTTTGDTVDVRLETVSAADGHPTGTLFGTNTNVAHIIANGDDNEMLQTAALTADAAVTVGDELAVVIVNGAAGNLNISIFNDLAGGFPYNDHFTASYAKSSTSPVLILEYSDATMVPIVGTVCHETESTVTSNATTWRGNIITPPFACRVVGYYFWPSSVTGAPNVKLFDEDGTTGSLSDALDADKLGATSVLMRRRFNGSKTLAANEPVYIAAAADGTNNLVWRVKDYDTQAIREGAEVAGLYTKYVTADGASPANPAAWTATETRMAWMGLLIDQLDNGSGGASGGQFISG
jgi:hypothetical protein